MSLPAFDFYAEVRVRNADSPFAGNRGVVFGRVETEDQSTWYYSIDFTNTTGQSCFYESELEATGVVYKREDFYDGTSVRIGVDKRGRGYVVRRQEEANGDAP